MVEDAGKPRPSGRGAVTANFGIKIGRANVATIRRVSPASGISAIAGFCLTLRNQDGARAGQYELTREVAHDLVRQLIGSAPLERAEPIELANGRKAKA